MMMIQATFLSNLTEDYASQLVTQEEKNLG